MKYQAYTYTVNVDSNGEFYVEEIIKSSAYETSERENFEDILFALGFHPTNVSMDPDFPNNNIWELILRDGQPVGQIHQIYV